MPDAREDAFASEGARNKDNPSINPSEAVAEIGQGLNFHLYLLMVGKRNGFKLSRGLTRAIFHPMTLWGAGQEVERKGLASLSARPVAEKSP